MQMFALYFAKYLLCLALQISRTEQKGPEDKKISRDGRQVLHHLKARTCRARNVAMRILLRDLISVSCLQGAKG